MDDNVKSTLKLRGRDFYVTNSYQCQNREGLAKNFLYTL